MRSFLLQPYPFSDNAAHKLLVCAGIGLFVIFFLAVFAPFGFDDLQPGVKWLHAGLFGAVTFVISSFFQLGLPLLIPSLFKEEGWRSWKEIIYLLVTTAFIGGGNYGLMLYLYPQTTEFSGLLRAEVVTLQVGIFPVLFIVFFKQLRLYRQYAAEAKTVTDDMEQIPEEEKPVLPTPSLQQAQTIVLQGDGAKEELTMPPHQLFFLASADNYVRVQFTKDGEMQSRLIRSTLKKMEEQLARHPEFFRCHRMYLINLHLVQSVSGNAQGLKLHLAGAEEPIPVSRSLTAEVKSRLHQLSHSPQNP